MLPRPAELAGRRTAYSVYVDDDLNAPVVRRGHVAYVDPTRPVAMGNMVRVFVLGAPSFFAMLEARTAKVVRLRGAGEPHPREFASERMARLERVVSFMLLDA